MSKCLCKTKWKTIWVKYCEGPGEYAKHFKEKILNPKCKRHKKEVKK